MQKANLICNQAKHQISNGRYNKIVMVKNITKQNITRLEWTELIH